MRLQTVPASCESVMDLSVVIVNYNNDRVLRTCLSSLVPALEGIHAEILLSDNGSTDGSLAWIRQRLSAVRILENRKNLGFAEANNRAFALARGRYIFMLNPDTVLFENSVRPMLTFLENNGQAGAVSCKLIAPDGSRQISARSFPTLLTYGLHFTGLSWRYTNNRFLGRFNMTYWDGESARTVDWVCGAALMFRREILTRVGGLDPGFFLVCDEVDFCRRIKQAGYDVWYIPDAWIVHLEGQSEPQSDGRPEGRLKYLTVERNSRVRYFVKHHGVTYATLVEVLHVLMNAVLLFKAKILGTKQSSRRTIDRALFLRLYWQTACRVPKACLAVIHRGRSKSNADHARVFVNPYVAGSG